MHIKYKLLSIGAAMLVSQAAFALGECDKYTTSYDGTYCMSKLFVESDKELNVVYKELHADLKGPVQKSLTSVQRDWIKYRDRACQPESGTIDVGCNYEVNRKRTEYLRDRLRECKAGTCRDDLIGTKSWQ